MRQDQRTNVPEINESHGTFDVQLKGDQWAVFDRATGGWSKGFDSYKAAERHAAELHEVKQKSAAQRINYFFNSRGNPA